jgi:large repetitive protein
MGGTDVMAGMDGAGGIGDGGAGGMGDARGSSGTGGTGEPDLTPIGDAARMGAERGIGGFVEVRDPRGSGGA